MTIGYLYLKGEISSENRDKIAAALVKAGVFFNPNNARAAILSAELSIDTEGLHDQSIPDILKAVEEAGLSYIWRTGDTVTLFDVEIIRSAEYAISSDDDLTIWSCDLLNDADNILTDCRFYHDFKSDVTLDLERERASLLNATLAHVPEDLGSKIRASLNG